MNTLAPSLREYLLPLSQPPQGPGWNRPMLDAMGLPTPIAEAAVLIALCGDPQDRQVLFTRRTDGLTHHAGQVSFPGGRADAEDADAIATATRETWEEIGLPPEQVTPLGYLDRLDTTSRYCITPVVAEVTGKLELRPAPEEVAEVFQVPLAYLLERNNYGTRRIKTPIGPRSTSEIHHDGHVIWGATAMMLLNLLRRLES